MLADCDVACEKHHVWSNCAKAHNYTKSSCSLKDGSLSAWRKFKPTAILKIYHNTTLFAYSPVYRLFDTRGCCDDCQKLISSLSF